MGLVSAPLCATEIGLNEWIEFLLGIGLNAKAFIKFSAFSDAAFHLVCVAWRFCRAGRRRGVGSPRNSRAKRARTSGEAARKIKTSAPISSRFLCRRPPLLLSAPNQNRHATQATFHWRFSIQDRHRAARISDSYFLHIIYWCYFDTDIKTGDNTPFRISIHDKREDFAFRMVNFPHMDTRQQHSRQSSLWCLYTCISTGVIC